MLIGAAAVVALVLAGGLVTAAGAAVGSLREDQRIALAALGPRGARAAELVASPQRLTLVARGAVTLISLSAATLSTATVAVPLAGVFDRWGLPAPGVVAVGGVLLALAAFVLVAGELAPRRLGRQRAVRVARIGASALDRLACAAGPLVAALSSTTDRLVGALGGDPHAAPEQLPGAQLRHLVATHPDLAVHERRLAGAVFSAATRIVRQVLVPRTGIGMLSADLTVAEALAEIVAAPRPHSRWPVRGASVDDLLGFVHVRDLLDAADVPLTERLRPLPMLTVSKPVLDALTQMRADRAHLAVVVDEYGGTAGIVTLEDLLAELVGDINDEHHTAAPPLCRRADGTLDVDAGLHLDAFTALTGVTLPPATGYATVGGYLMCALSRMPQAGDAVTVDGHQLVVADLDGHRVVRVAVLPAGQDVPASTPSADSPATAAPSAA